MGGMKNIRAAFRAAKSAAGLAYAITAPDAYGDCCSCVDCALGRKYGIDSRGIYIKRWRRGMNATDTPETGDTLYIAHDLNGAEQYGKVIETLTAYGLRPSPIEYDESKCIQITIA